MNPFIRAIITGEPKVVKQFVNRLYLYVYNFYCFKRRLIISAPTNKLFLILFSPGLWDLNLAAFTVFN
jgi:hypothetical protein